jgi:hypothetical protein
VSTDELRALLRHPACPSTLIDRSQGNRAVPIDALSPQPPYAVTDDAVYASVPTGPTAGVTTGFSILRAPLPTR